MREIKSISSKIRNKVRVSTLKTCAQFIFEVLLRGIKQNKEIKGTQIRKEGRSQAICTYKLYYS